MAKKTAAPQATSRELSLSEQIALASAVKSQSLSAAKRSLQDGMTATVDFTVRITGAVSKAYGVAASKAEADADVAFVGEAGLCEILSRLGVGPDRLRSVLEAIVDDAHAAGQQTIGEHCFGEKPKLKGVIAEVTAKAQALLPKRQVDVPAKAGAVTASVSVTVVSP